MDPSLVGFAVAAGLVAALNPCGFAMLPAYLSLVVLGEDGSPTDGRRGAVGRALLATLLMTAGFLVVFGAFGLVVAPLAAELQRFLPVVTVVIGVVMVVLGIWLLAGRTLTVFVPRSGRGAPTRGLWSMAGYGVAYAIASLSCTIGPFLAVSAASFGAGSVLDGVVAYLAYGLGMAVVVGVLAVAVAVARGRVASRARRLLPHVHRISGVLLVLVGLYVGYYGVYEIRQNAGSVTADPVVDAAGVVQQTLAGWVDTLGLWPIAAVLVVLVVGAAIAGRWRAVRRRTSASSGETGAR